MTIGESIKAARKKAGLTQKQLAERLGASFTLVSQYERGTRNPKPETLSRIATALGTTLEAIYGSQESGIISELPEVYNVPIETGMAMTLDWLARKNNRTLEEEVDIAIDSYLNWASDDGRLEEEYYTPESVAQRDKQKKDLRFYPALLYWLDQLNEDGFLKIYEMAVDFTSIGRYQLNCKSGEDMEKAPPNYVSAYHVLLRLKGKFPWSESGGVDFPPQETTPQRPEKPENTPAREGTPGRSETPQNEPQGQKDGPKQEPEEQ